MTGQCQKIPHDDALRTLNQELKATLDRLAMVGSDLEEWQELQRQRDVTQQKIHQLESTTNACRRGPFFSNEISSQCTW